MRGMNRVKAAILIALALAAMPAGAAAAPATDAIATLEKAAVVPVAAPPRTSAPTYLDLWVSAFRPPQRGAVEAAVTLGTAGGDETEIGRFTIFPGEPFTAKNGETGRSYRFNVTTALAKLAAGDGPLLVRVRLLPIDPAISSADAEMTIGRAEFRSGL
jgi:hypothetical protein